MFETIKVKIPLLVVIVLLITALSTLFISKASVEKEALKTESQSAKSLVKLMLSEVQTSHDHFIIHQQTTLDHRKDLLRHGLEMAVTGIDLLRELEKESGQGEEGSRRDCLEWLSRLSLNGEKSYFVLNRELESMGRIPSSFSIRAGVVENRYGLRDKLKRLASDGEDFSVILKPDPDLALADERLAMFHYCKAWGWIVGASVSLGDLVVEREMFLAGVKSELKGLFKRIEETYPGIPGVFNGQKEIIIHPQLAGLNLEDAGVSLKEGLSLDQAMAVARTESETAPFDYRLETPLIKDRNRKGDMVAFVNYFRPLDWYLVYTLPVSELKRPGREIAINLLYLLPAPFFICLIWIYMVIRRFTGPIGELTRCAEELSGPGCEQPSGFRRRLAMLESGNRDETGKLARAFERMLSSLEKRMFDLERASREKSEYAAMLEQSKLDLERMNRDLETLVKKRTKALTETNSSLSAEVRDRKRIEDVLRKTNAQLQGVLDHTPSIILLKNNEGAIIMANPRAAKLLARPISEIVGKTAWDLLPDFEASAAEEEDKRILATGRTMAREKTLHLGDKLHTLTSTKFPLKDKDGSIRGICCIMTDITEKRMLQFEALRRAQLASLGELAAGVAHEVNNPVNGVINYAQLIKDEELSREEQVRIAERIMREGDRVAGIIKNLLSYGKPWREGQASACRLGEILSEALTLARTQMEKEGIIFKIKTEPDCPLVKVGPGEVRQIILNLLSNARHALNQKYPGRSAEKVLEIWIGRAEVLGRTVARMTFRDNGTGVSGEDLGKIFEPFYSTKPDNQGAGLGLSISRKIAEGLGGTLDIESVEGEYALVRLDLPTA